MTRQLGGFLLFTCFIITIASCTYSKKTAARLYKEAVAAAPFDAIIVPGIQFENGKWDRVMMGRIYWAKFLYEKRVTRNIIFSGSSVYSPYYEAEIMKLYAIELGIPADHIFAEKKAEHSTENAWYSYKYGKKLGFNKMALASDPFQTKLLRRYIRRKVSKDVPVIPFVVDTLKVLEPSMMEPKIDYEQAHNPSFISIKKRDSFWRRMKGTLFGNIDKTAYE